jgi:hypothetical protein
LAQVSVSLAGNVPRVSDPDRRSRWVVTVGVAMSAFRDVLVQRLAIRVARPE